MLVNIQIQSKYLQTQRRIQKFRKHLRWSSILDTHRSLGYAFQIIKKKKTVLRRTVFIFFEKFKNVILIILMSNSNNSYDKYLFST